MLLTVHTWSEKSYEVNKDFKLFTFRYIKYSTLLNGDNHWNYIVITQKLNQNYMNLDIFVVDALNHFSCGMQCFNDSKACYNNSYLNLTADLMLWKIF